MLSWAKKMQSTPTAQVFFPLFAAQVVIPPFPLFAAQVVIPPSAAEFVIPPSAVQVVFSPSVTQVIFPPSAAQVVFPPFPTASPAFASPRFSTSPAQSPVLTSGILLSTSAPRLSDSNISVPLLNEHDAGRDGAIRDYYIWRAIALLLHCTSRQLILHFFISYPPSGAILHRPHGLGYMSILYIR